MLTKKIKLSRIAGVLSIVIFFSLLAVRLGVFQTAEKEEVLPRTVHSETWKDREQWMNVLQNGKKVGYVQRQYFRAGDGYKITEQVFIQVNTMGMGQDLRFKTVGHFADDLTLASFNFDLKSSLFRFKAWGIRNGDRLTLFAGTPGSEQRTEIPFDKEIHLPVSLLEAVRDGTLKPGERRTVHVFDPATLARRPVKVTVVGDETISVMGREEEARKVSVDFMGSSQFAWIGKEGTILREEGSLGMKLEQTTKKEALNLTALSAGTDLTELVSIPSKKVIHFPQQLRELRVKIEGIEKDGFFLDGGRQSFKEGWLVVRRESLSNLRQIPPDPGVSEATKALLAPTPFIQSDHPEIKAKAREIISGATTDLMRARRLITWVHENVQKRPVLSVPNALETLHHLVGDCNEHAVLLAALARAAGIPADVEAGIVYQQGRFYYHAWNVLYLGKWVTADATVGQMPADVTHLRFVRGTDQQMDLMGVIGRLRLEEVEAT